MSDLDGSPYAVSPPASPYQRLVGSGANTFTATQTIDLTGKPASVGLIVKEDVAQGGNLIEFRASNSAIIASVNALGAYTTTGAVSCAYVTDPGNTIGYFDMGNTAGVGVLLTNRVAGRKAYVIQAAAGQSVNIQEWQNSAAGVLAGIDQNGGFSTFGTAGASIAGDTDMGYSRTGRIRVNATGVGLNGNAPVAKAAAITAPAATASTNVTPFGYSTAAQADAVVSAVRAIITALQNIGVTL